MGFKKVGVTGESPSPSPTLPPVADEKCSVYVFIRADEPTEVISVTDTSGVEFEASEKIVRRTKTGVVSSQAFSREP